MEQRPVHSSDELIDRAIALAREGRKRTVAVAAAQDVDVIGAMSQAEAEGFLHGVLVGDADLVRKLAKEGAIDISKLELVDVKGVSEAAHAAVKLAADGRAGAIMKGFLPTSSLLKVVLDKQYGLRGKNTLSHCAVLDIPGYHKLLNLTDGGMVVKPDPETKYQVLENAVLVARALGLSPVKIAVSAAVDSFSNKVPHIQSDITHLIPTAEKNLKDIVIQGPITFELATSKQGFDYKDEPGLVIGDADIFLVDSIEECNIIAKSLVQFAEAVFAGVIVGAKVPVSLVSRTDTVKNKKASLALACVLADYYERNKVWG
jgi:phosphate butyryltransferase